MRTHHLYYARRRQAKKSHRRSALFGIFVVLLLLCVYGVVSYGKHPSTLPAKITSTRTSLAKDTTLAWPAHGQAAIGSVEDGLLTKSAENGKPRPIASMAKVITALAIMKKQPIKSGQSGPSYTITSRDVANYHAYVARGGSVLPVREGMVLTQYEAMQAMLLPSANNIADMLAERVFGSKEAYASYAQDMMDRMGLTQTNVADASGFSPQTTSTPSNLVEIGIAAMKDPVIAGIVAQSQAQIPSVGIVENTNKLLGVDGVIGLKTGTTAGAGNCLLFAARYSTRDGQGVMIVGVIMGDLDAATLFGDTRGLLVSVRQTYDLIE